MQQAPVGLEIIGSAMRMSPWLEQPRAGVCPAERLSSIYNLYPNLGFLQKMEKNLNTKRLWVFSSR